MAFFWIAKQEHRSSLAHIAFKAKRPEDIEAFHSAASANGGRDNGPPGLRPKYQERYYAAFGVDPDGNNVEAVIQ